MSEPEFSDRHQLPDSSRPTEQLRPAQGQYRNPGSYAFHDSKRNQHMTGSMPRQYHSPQQDPAAQMLSELTHLLRSFKEVMVQAKRFFGKYLPQEQNHFRAVYSQQSPSHDYRSQRQPQSRRQSYPQPNQWDQYSHTQISEHQNFDESEMTKPQAREAPSEKKWGFGKKAKNQDPNKPKAPLTPYFLFFSQTRELLRKKYPEMSLAEIGTLGGKVWRQLKQEQRLGYKNRYEEERGKYKLQLDEYNSSGGVLNGKTADSEQFQEEQF